MQIFFPMQQPGSLRPLRTVRASFPAYGSSTFKAPTSKGNPTVNLCFLINKSSDLSTFFCQFLLIFKPFEEVLIIRR